MGVEGLIRREWALREGIVTRYALEKDYRLVYPGIYLPKGVELDARGRTLAAAFWGGDKAVLVGFSALVMHGVQWFAEEPAELSGPNITRAPAGVVARQYELLPQEVVSIDGVRVTSAERTGYDLGRRLRFGTAVAVLDSLCQVTGLVPGRILEISTDHPRARGNGRLREVIGYVDAGAESPQETRTRLLLLAAGFPRPTTQIEVRDEYGRFVARLDMGWPEWKVAVEYDGAQHWTDKRQYAHDIDRQARLTALGWTIIRVSSSHLHTHPHTILTRTAAALRAAGAPIPDEHAIRQANVEKMPAGLHARGVSGGRRRG
ncbi:DUF559 domain-containing protein [Nocardia sp. CDC153]|uniref:endonuclease domain-containing protein n=1 Tax=Nocardia sp. CDC153 TaxID=3112167 RepID=UPI002DC0420B|nr:DUF559 domain-containing protein [Nocardia sp. CDC153]MEC3956471.1 DUF559 domain-containing protein [Nocardia sp. CDC153]